MRYHAVTLSNIAIGHLLLITPAYSAGLHDPLDRWEAFDKRVDHQAVSACAGAIRDSATRGDARVLDRLIRIVKSERQGATSRLQAMDVACEIADNRGAHVLLETMQAVRLEHRRALGDGETYHDPAGAPIVNATLLVRFIHEGVEHLMQVMDDQTALLEFLKSIYLGRGISMSCRSQCARLIADCKVPLKTRQEAVLDIVKTNPPGGVPKAFFDVLDPTVFPALRRLVRGHNAPDKFNFSAADALSYLGDLEIVPDLEARRAVFLAVHRNYERVLRQYLWRIAIQHPPTKLLDYIASTRPREQHNEMRMWAVRRTSELGVDHEQIRQAILHHVTNASTALERGELTYLKWIAMKLGILQDTDLPNVTVGDTGVKR